RVRTLQATGAEAHRGEARAEDRHLARLRSDRLRRPASIRPGVRRTGLRLSPGHKKTPGGNAGRLRDLSWPPGSSGGADQRLGEDADGFFAVDALDGRHFAGHPVERRFIELAFGV